MGKTVVIPSGNWTSHLADALEDDDVSEIVVLSEAARLVALDGIESMGITRELQITVRWVDPLAKFYGEGE